MFIEIVDNNTKKVAVTENLGGVCVCLMVCLQWIMVAGLVCVGASSMGRHVGIIMRRRECGVCVFSCSVKLYVTINRYCNY